MNIQELAQQLVDEGCNPSSYALGMRGSASDAYCLTQMDGIWHIYYTERGVDQTPFFESPNEAEACARFFQFMMGLRHDHLVGFFRREVSAINLQALLQQHNILSHQDSILYSSPDDRRYRVFVIGKAIFAARELLDEIPLQDDISQ